MAGVPRRPAGAARRATGSAAANTGASGDNSEHADLNTVGPGTAIATVTAVNINVRPATADDAARIEPALVNSWGSTMVVAHGTEYDLTALPTLVAEHAGELVGVLSYDLDGDALEVVTIDAIDRRRGVGSALIAAATDEARKRGCRRLWLVTTNDNLDALRFYQRRGLRIVGVTPDGIEHARQLKPAIPDVGEYGIPIRDELTLELLL